MRIPNRNIYRGSNLKTKILSLALSLAVFLGGCCSAITGKYQNIPVTSDPPGAKVTASSTGNSIITPGSFNLVRNRDHILLAEYPGYEPQEKELKHKLQGWFWSNILLTGPIGLMVDSSDGASDKLTPKKVHFNFSWLEPRMGEKSRIADSNVPSRKLLGHIVMMKAPGKFTRTPVYDDVPDEVSPAKGEPNGPEPDVPSPAVQPMKVQDESADFRAALQRQAFDISQELYYYKYEEPHIMDNKGMFYGVAFGYISRGWVPASPEESLSCNKGGAMFRTEGRFAYGQVDYDGALSDGTPYTLNDIDDFALEARVLLGLDALNQNTLHTPYMGIGYRYLNDDTSFDPYGYERESNYLYLPVGYQFDSNLKDGWSWGLRVEYDVFLWGSQVSHLSDVGLSDVDNRQTSGYGYRVATKFQHKRKNGTLIIEPFFRYWDIDKSRGSDSGGFEPANKTTEYGIQLVWRF